MSLTFHRLPITVLIAALVLAACAPAAPASSGQLRAVATFSILGDLVQNIGGSAVELTVLVGPDGDAHTFQPSPSDSANIASADVIFENGLEFETWLDDLYTASASRAARVVVTQGLTPLALEEAHDEHGGTPGAEHGEFDPHAWGSVPNAILMAQNIREALITADPANADIYQANAQKYIDDLKSLDQWVTEQVTMLPAERRKLVTTHDTFGYFAHQYGFEIVGTALGSTTDIAGPSAAGIAALVEEIRATGVPAIFAENIANPKLMEQIATEAGVKLGPPLYTDALGPLGSPGESYLQMVRYNVNSIVNALK
jgi:ABC-type Zn uptake system ZnuABC Zn-binding protein ZnuA